MPPATAACLNAITGANRLALNGSLLPFLYCTRTIRGQHDFQRSYRRTGDDDRRPRYSEHKGRDRHDGLDTGREGKGRDPRDTRDRAGSARIEYDRPRRPRERDVFSEIEDSHSRDGDASRSDMGVRYGDANRPSRPARSEWIDHVPFELPEGEVETEEFDDGTTITPAERKAFEKLKAMKPPPPKEEAAQPSTEVATNAGPSIRKHVGGSPQWRHHLQNTALSKAIEADLNRVESLMLDAQTDVDLWRVFQEQVISRVLALELDQPKTVEEKEDRRKARQRKKRAEAKKADVQTPQQTTSLAKPTDEGPKDLDILTRSLRQHVLTFLRICRQDFPSSSYPLSLIPYLKSLGPLTFAMAASTTLYNNHMRWLYRRYTDLPAIISTLVEMDRDVVEFDNRTSDLLSGIIRRNSWIQYGNLGESAKCYWDGPRVGGHMRWIRMWFRNVENSLQEKALREAKAREEEEEDQEAMGDGVASYRHV